MKISVKQGMALEIIKALPGVYFADVAKQIGTGIEQSTLSKAIHALTQKGLVRREGTDRKYQHYWTGEPWTVVEHSTLEQKPNPSGVVDEKLRQAASIRLTPDQKEYVRANKCIPRSQLAKHFGMTKLEFNFAMAHR